MEVFDENPNNTEKTVTGTAAAGYVAVLTMYRGNGLIAAIKNTGLTNAMNFKINGYLTETALAYALKTETSLAANTAYLYPTGTDGIMPFYKIEILVQYLVAATTYQIDAKKY